MADAGAVDLCGVDPGFEIDPLVLGSLRSMTAVWMGIASVHDEVASGRIELLGDSAIARSMQQWLGLSVSAGEKRRVS